MNPHKPPDTPDAEVRLVGCLDLIAEHLGFALALERDATLRVAVSGLVPRGGPCLLALGPDGPFLGFADGHLTNHGVLGGEASPAVPMVDLSEALRISRTFRETALARLVTCGAQAEANRLVRALQQDAHAYSAEDFGKLGRWAPLLATDAYVHTAATQIVLDETRERIRRKPSEGALRRRWDQIHSLSHSTLLATSAEPTTWLVHMAESFEWQTWTPSFPLVRERVLRLAMRGAWAAARFGVGLTDRYLRVIVDGKQPLHCFDAVLGATAIALASPALGSGIVRGIEHALRHRIDDAIDPTDRLVAEACLRSVHVAVDDPFLAEEETLRRGYSRGALPVRNDENTRRRALFRALDDEVDCAEIDGKGFMPAILALPSVTAASPDVFFPTAALRFRASTTESAVARAREAFARSVGPALCLCGSGKSAAACCAN